MFRNIVTIMLVGVSLALSLSGCATHRYVQPSIEELQAVMPYKKKIAVMEASDKGSPIKGISENVASSIESLLSKQFNLVERRLIDQILAERQFISYEDPENMAQLGKLLGADYLVFAHVVSSISKPEIEKSSRIDKKGEFYGSISKSRHVHSDISLKIIDTSNGLVIFAEKRDCALSHKFDTKTYNDEHAYNQALKTTYLIDNLKEIKGDDRIKQENSGFVAQSVDCAVKHFRDALIRQFPYTGEVIEVVSPTAVMINLGSAYGLRPGDRLVVYSQEPKRIDPRTGIAIDQRIPSVILRIRDVTSGISCIATGRAADIRLLQIGSIVSTYEARR